MGAVAAAAVAGVGSAVFGSAATLPVAPRNHTAFRTCALTAFPASTTTASDSWADESSKNAKHGGATTLLVKSHSGKNARIFIRFDLAKCVPVIPSAATVMKATLRLNLAAAPSVARTYAVNRITGPCPEAATTCWTESGLTWNNKPAFAATPTSTLVLSATSTVNEYYNLDVTADAAVMVAGTASNYGWQIADSVEGNATAITATFQAKEPPLLGNHATVAPQLVLVYRP